MSVCVSVCLSVGRLSQKVTNRFLMKFGRMVYNDKISIPFEDEINRSIKTEVTDNLLFQNHELPPFDNFFRLLLPLFYYSRGEMQ